MSTGFRVALLEHGYRTTEYERAVVQAAGGEFLDFEGLPLDEALSRSAEADAVLVRRVSIGEAEFARMPRCKIIVRYGVGTDNIDLDAATKRGIIVGHVPTYCVDEVATHAAALLLASLRDVAATHERMRAGGAWQVRRAVHVYRMQGRTLGIVGLGQIGRAFARRMRGWGLRLLATDPWVEPERARELGASLVGLDELCEESDYISLHCPLLPETHHLLDAARMATMKPGSILVNTSRGPVVDTAALPAALGAGCPARAALDVFEAEPLPADSPLRAHPAVILTDHMAWYSEDSQVELQRQAAEEAVRVATGGLPLSLANPEVLRRLDRWDEWTPPETMRWQLRRLREG